MSASRAYEWADDSSAWRGDALGGDVVARLQDFLVRKKGVAAEKWSQFLGHLEANLSPAQLKAALRDALRSWRRQPVSDAVVDEEFGKLCTMIRAHGRKTSIENYGEYLFTVRIDL